MQVQPRGLHQVSKTIHLILNSALGHEDSSLGCTDCTDQSSIDDGAAEGTTVQATK